MRDLIVSNHALGDRDALDRIWDEHGYWFFRDVLDKDALAAMRDEYMRELKVLDFVAADAAEPLWNGRSTETFPARFDALHDRRVWQTFVGAPKIKAFFEDVLNDAIYWIPMDYYRLVAPKKKTASADFNIGVHQDGMSNPGVEFVTCWMPLIDIDDDVGGLVIAPGQHRRGYMDIVDGKAQFANGPVPDEAWSRADYRPGDVVIFTRSMPHFGQSNSSDRFRLSLDIRAVRQSSRLPVVGEVRAITTDRVVIRNEDGVDVALVLDDKTFLRGPAPNSPNPVPIKRPEVVQALPPGALVMATEENGRALILRPQA